VSAEPDDTPEAAEDRNQVVPGAESATYFQRERNVLSGLLLILLVNAVYLNWRAFQGFNFIDYGSALDAGWRLISGQEIYRDFLYHTGPVHPYLLAAAMTVFGFSKAAVLALLVVLSTIVVVTCFFVARPAGKRAALFSAVVAAVCFYWPIGFPWFDHTAYVFTTVGLGLFALTSGLSARAQTLAGFAIGACAALSYLSKSNIGLATFGVSLVMAPLMKRSLAGIATVAAGFALACLILVLPNSPELFYTQTVQRYGAAQSYRLLWVLDPIAMISHWYFAAVFGVILCVWKRLHRDEAAMARLLACAFCVAWFSLKTGSVQESCHVPLGGLLAALALRALMDLEQPLEKCLTAVRARQMAVAVAAVMTAWCAYSGFTLRWYADQPIFSSYGDYRIRAEGMRGWTCRPADGAALDGMVDYLREHAEPDDAVLNLSWMYPVTPLLGRDSFRGITFIWFVDNHPQPGAESVEVRDQIMNNLPEWILADSTEGNPFGTLSMVEYMGLDQAGLFSHYAPVKRWDPYTLLRRKADSAAEN
jgi:hypothetical protein